jgi:hypothetical protein
MALRYRVAGGVDDNWGTSGNWATSSGGAGGAGVPTSADDVFLDANSPSTTINASARVCKSLDFTGYPNTITMSQQITVSGSVTLIAGLSIAGASGLIVNATGTLTSNTKVWPNSLSLNGSNATYTLADAWNVDGLLSLGVSTSPVTINGFSITASAGLTHNASSGAVQGTTAIIMDGSGTFTPSSGTGTFQLPLTINTAGTITGASGTFKYHTGTFTYTAGTVDMSLTLLESTAATTLNLNGVTWAAVRLATSNATVTLSSGMQSAGVVTMGTSNLLTTIAGSQIITSSGGFRYGGTSGSVAGPVTLKVTATSTLDAPTQTTTGCFRKDVGLLIDAPGATVTIDTGFLIDLGMMQINDVGSIVTDAGTWSLGGGGGTTLNLYAVE